MAEPKQKQASAEEVLAQILATIPSMQAAAADAPRPLGVPADYVAERQIPDADAWGPGVIRAPQGPQYFEGMQYLPAALDPVQVSRLQARLAGAGLYGPKGRYRNGTWDEASAQAYEQLLSFANRAGLDEEAALVRYSSEGAADKGTGALQARVTNPLDLRALADETAKTVYGRRLREDELARLTGGFQALEVGAQAAADTGAGVVTDAPSAQSFLENELRRVAPQEAQRQDIEGHMQKFLGTLKGEQDTGDDLGARFRRVFAMLGEE